MHLKDAVHGGPGLAIMTVALLIAACGGDTAAPEEQETSFAFGEVAAASSADDTIQVEATDPFVFTPDNVDVEVGETVTFEVTNTDAIDHDFVIGDEEAQDEHEEEMREMDDMEGMEGEMEHDDPNAITISAGETASITWTFTEPGEVLFGCHEPGHYDAGMYGTVTVTG